MGNQNDATRKHTDEGGEGNYDASRRYREGLERSVEQGKAEELGKKAKEALEGEEGEDLRDAEKKGKRADIPGEPPPPSAAPKSKSPDANPIDPRVF